MNGDFIFGLCFGVALTYIVMTPKHRKGFKDLVVGVWNKLTGKGGNKAALVALPYWLEWRLVVILFVGGFLYVVWRGNGKSLRIIPEAFGGFFKRLWDMFFHNIEDREAYEANREQREADEAYKKAMKEGKGGGKIGNENEEFKDKDKKEQDEDCDKPY